MMGRLVIKLWIIRFCDGLSPQILERVIVLNVTDYTEMVHVATMAEKGIREEAADYMNRKRMKFAESLPHLPPSKRHSSSGSGSEKKDTPASHVSVNVPQCTKCGKAHPGKCRSGTGLCFRCGKPGHFARRCLNLAIVSRGTQARDNQPKPTALARMYNMLASEEDVKANEAPANAATGTTPLSHGIVCICLD
jgi:hypothetical protein